MISMKASAKNLNQGAKIMKMAAHIHAIDLSGDSKSPEPPISCYLNVSCRSPPFGRKINKTFTEGKLTRAPKRHLELLWNRFCDVYQPLEKIRNFCF